MKLIFSAWIKIARMSVNDNIGKNSCWLWKTYEYFWQERIFSITLNDDQCHCMQRDASFNDLFKYSFIYVGRLEIKHSTTQCRCILMNDSNNIWSNIFTDEIIIDRTMMNVWKKRRTISSHRRMFMFEIIETLIIFHVNMNGPKTAVKW